MNRYSTGRAFPGSSFAGLAFANATARRGVACVALAVLLVGMGAADGLARPETAAPVVTPAPSTKSPGSAPDSPAQAENSLSSVDRLFERLRQIRDEDEGEGVAQRIEEQWMRSGSPTADLLMRRAIVVVQGGDQALGVELLDRVIAIRPAWAEAWNRRAALFTLMGDDERAVIDLRKALQLEPRHYQALAAMGAIFSKNDDDRNAVRAWRKSLEINPFQSALKERVQRLAPDVEGRDL